MLKGVERYNRREMTSHLVSLLSAIVAVSVQNGTTSQHGYAALRKELGVAAVSSPTDLSKLREILKSSRVCEIVCRIDDMRPDDPRYDVIYLKPRSQELKESATVRVVRDKTSSGIKNLLSQPARLLVQRYETLPSGESIVKVIAAIPDVVSVTNKASNKGKAAPLKLEMNKKSRGDLGQSIAKTTIYSARSTEAKRLYTANPYEYLVIVGEAKDGWLPILLQNGAIGYVLSKDVATLPYDVDLKKIKPISVTASALAQAFERNELAATDHYSGRELKLTGTILRIAETSEGNPYLILKGSKSMTCHVIFHESWRSDLKKKRTGSTVKLTARLIGRSIFMINLQGVSLE